MAVSIIRDIKEVDMAQNSKREATGTSPSRLVFDPIAADARFPGTLVNVAELTCALQLTTLLQFVDLYLPS